ncbi:putative bifunctional diguanylate cyclase/phosphodiesterase [Oceanobacter mangrovi]|uniref:putative bifunctional diguanylate cyclase/phosphodiesterase n=1 Tax=Oceanobacter mangrovi TaxID=2862510 RepID=UPI001C8DA2BF|nr:EAL domain-containing protein [Oceanobacter mangrovi]
MGLKPLQNSWAYTGIVAVTLVLFFWALLIDWQDTVDDVLDDHQQLVQLSQSAFQTLLADQEVLLDFAGWEIMRDNPEAIHGPVRQFQLLAHLSALSPAILALGVATPQGDYFAVSDDSNKDKIPNLLEQPEARESFLEVLQSDRLQLGRTYWFEALHTEAPAIRKTLRDDRGEPLAVVVAGLKLSGVATFFDYADRLDDNSVLMLVRARDGYLQYFSANTQWPSLNYETPLSTDVTSVLHDIPASDQIVARRVEFNLAGKRMHGVAMLDSDNGIWVVSVSEKRVVVYQYLLTLMFYCIGFALFQLVLFLLFTVSRRAEQAKQDALRYQATHDSLTRLVNRSHVFNLLDDWLQQHRYFSLFYIDMDYFKNINDNFGHEFGDKVLQEVARRLLESIPAGAIAARHGGDEFLVLMADDDCYSDVRVAEQILRTLACVYRIDGVAVELGVSIGIASSPDHATDQNGLLRAADLAMYQAKKHRNCVRRFEPDMHQEHMHKLDMEYQMRTAISNNEFFVVYQPQVNVDGKLHGVEVLLRWQNESLGMVSPGEFIPLAETIGIMPRLGAHIMELALLPLRQLQKHYDCEFQVSLNISVRQFMDPEFVSVLCRKLDEAAMPRHLVTLEITESLFIDDVQVIVEVLEQVRLKGLKLSLDDFGTGYSSLSMLATLPMDELKIDKSFVDHLMDSRSAQVMVRNIIDIGRNYGMSLLAEGVETEAQLRLLHDMGCALYQGYYFAKPLSAQDLASWLASHQNQ